MRHIQLELFDRENIPEPKPPERAPLPPNAWSPEQWQAHLDQRPAPGRPNWTPEMEARRQQAIKDVRAFAKKWEEEHPEG